MSTAETWTVGRLLTWTAEFLKKHGSTSPRLDAEVLLAEARGCQRIDLYTAFSEEPSDEVRASFKEMVRRRAEGSPVAYLVGRKEFYSLNFEVNPDVLIPRPETEHLVVEALDRAKLLRPDAVSSSTSAAPSLGPPSAAPALEGQEDQMDIPIGPRPKPQLNYSGLRIADVGTGSGIVAICLAKSLPGASVTAIDVSRASLAQATRNVAKHAVESQLQLVESDLFSQVPPGQFDIIVSNPPYISESEYVNLPVSVRDYEPKTALVAPDEGTGVISRLIQEATSRLRVGGYLLFELSPMIVDRVVASIDRTLWSEPEVIKDLAGLPRVVTIQRLR